MAHAAAGRGGGAGDEGDDRLGDLGGDVFGGLLLGEAADLADEHDGDGVGVLVEHAQGFHGGGADDGVAADADAGGLADVALRELGDDLVDGGARYSFGDGVCMVGVVDAANSLAVVKKLIFEDKKLTMGQLREALAADFEGYEELERMCIAAPKYGNDEEYTDQIAKDIYNICYNLHEKIDHLGRPVMPSAYSVTGHVAFGEFTGTLPNGKKAKKPLVDASVSAQGGTDKNGPTALVKSAAKIIDTVKYSSNHLNMKFHPTALRGMDGARKLLSLIKTYFDLGGYHVQFNCISGETLRDAQLHPENYKELVVRVAGFSAYFVTLDKDTQDDIVRRTELTF